MKRSNGLVFLIVLALVCWNQGAQAQTDDEKMGELAGQTANLLNQMLNGFAIGHQQAKKDAITYIDNSLEAMSKGNLQQMDLAARSAIQSYKKFSPPYLILSYDMLAKKDIADADRYFNIYNKFSAKIENNEFRDKIPQAVIQQISAAIQTGISQTDLPGTYANENWLKRRADIEVVPNSAGAEVGVSYAHYKWFNQNSSFPSTSWNKGFELKVTCRYANYFIDDEEEVGSAGIISIQPAFFLNSFYIAPISVNAYVNKDGTSLDLGALSEIRLYVGKSATARDYARNAIKNHLNPDARSRYIFLQLCEGVPVFTHDLNELVGSSNKCYRPVR